MLTLCFDWCCAYAVVCGVMLLGVFLGFWIVFACYLDLLEFGVLLQLDLVDGLFYVFDWFCMVRLVFVIVGLICLSCLVLVVVDSVNVWFCCLLVVCWFVHF